MNNTEKTNLAKNGYKNKNLEPRGTNKQLVKEESKTFWLTINKF